MSNIDQVAALSSESRVPAGAGAVRRLRVLRLITRLNVGGPARQALLLSKELADWPTLLAAGEPPPQEGELRDADVPVHRLSLVRPVSPLNDLRAYRQVRRLLNQTLPTILHTHMAKAGLVGRLAAHRRPVRTVHTFHGHVLEGYFGPALQRSFLEMERRLARSTDVLVAISPEVRDSLLDLGVGRPRQYEVIPLGFDLTSHLQVAEPTGALRHHLGISPETPLIGVIGRLVPIKDVATFVETLQRLPGVHGVVIGDGEERGALKRLSRDLGVADRTHFTGWWSDIPAAMSDLDVVALTSRNEGTPVSLIEAAACARAVVATEVGGVRFVVKENQTGFLVPPGRVDQLADAIRRLVEDEGLRRRFGAAGREEVRSRFHKDRLLADIDALYADLTGRRDGSA